MTKSFVAIAALALAAGFSSCSKSDSNDTLPTNYKIDGVHDVTVQPIVAPNNYLSLTVSYAGPIQERVDLSIEGVPQGCGSDVSVSGGYPTFSSNITFMDTSATPGTYPIKLVCQGSKTGKKSYSFNLIVKPEPDYGSAFLGSYPNTYNSCYSSTTYATTITASGQTNKIYLNNIDNNATTVYAMVSYMGQMITIPSQTVNGITYSGVGYPNPGSTSFTMQYTMTTPSSQYSCSVNFSK